MMDFKPEPVQFTLLTYYCIINITAAVLTVTDKRRAQKKQWRVPERTLLLLGAAGGALGEFIAMLCIRHKQNNLKFVISMPVFIVTAHRPFLSDFFALRETLMNTKYKKSAV